MVAVDMWPWSDMRPAVIMDAGHVVVVAVDMVGSCGVNAWCWPGAGAGAGAHPGACQWWGQVECNSS